MRIPMFIKCLLRNIRPNETIELKTKVMTSKGRESSVFTAKYTRRTK